MSTHASFKGLTPILLFVILVVMTGVAVNDFTAMPVLVALLISSAYALLINGNNASLTISEKIDIFCRGAGDKNIILLALIFLLAGAFYALTIEIGARDATVNWALQYIPSHFLLPGLFVISSFIAFSMGTSMGTISAITPVGVGLAESLGFSVPLAAGIVIGGAMFGDNLSFVSDTTIAATKTQMVKLSDKFKANVLIVLPAALATALLLIMVEVNDASSITLKPYNLLLLAPYAAVIIAALLGMNVIFVLGIGIISAGTIGLLEGSFNLIGFLATVQTGMGWMQNLAFIALFIGGIIGLMQAYGGMNWLMQVLTNKAKTKKGAELRIAGLVSCMDIVTANNTIAIVASGTIAKALSEKFKVDPKRVASILDIFSCGFQGILPYGGQLLTAGVLAGVSPLSIAVFCWYPALILVAGTLAIALGFPHLNASTQK